VKTLAHICITSILLLSFLAACTMGVSPDAQQDTVNTAIAGTQMAEVLAQATVNANTLTAMPATPTPGPTIEYVTLTEEELVALIDQAVAEAVSACEQTTQAASAAAGDDMVTDDEVQYVYTYYYYTDYYLDYAEELLSTYYDLYADLAQEMIAELNALEEELAQLNDTMIQISDSLAEISDTLSQGLEVAQESIVKLENAAQQAQSQAAMLQEQRQDIMSTLQTDQQHRMEEISQIQPSNIPADRTSALQAGFQFIDFANSALTDGKISRDELVGLAQLGANAQAGFKNFGGTDRFSSNTIDLSQFSARFTEITTQFARGQMPQARGNLQQFEFSLDQRPVRNSPRP
jgi:hypothetical protein